MRRGADKRAPGKGAVTGEAGFTLLEVMISLAILAGVVVAVLTSLSYHMGVAQRSTDVVTAAMLGREKSEEAALAGRAEAGKGTYPAPLDRFSWSLVKAETEVPGIERVGIAVGAGGRVDVTFVSYFEK